MKGIYLFPLCGEVVLSIRGEAQDIYIAGADPGAKPLPMIASADSSVQLRLVLAVSYDVSSLIFVRDQPYPESS